jgi:hypothetical protein
LCPSDSAFMVKRLPVKKSSAIHEAH